MSLLNATKNYFEANKYRRKIASFLVIAIAFTYLLVVSWHKCGDLIIDSPREMWVPLQILKGKVLYKDIYYFHGPLPAYFLALLYKIFGISLNTLMACGICTTILMCLCIYKLAKIYLDEIASVITVLNFCFAFAFGVYDEAFIANYIFPYSFASSFCMLFLSAALYFFVKHIESENTSNLIVWAIFLTLSALSRPETAFSVWIVFMFSGLLIKNGRPSSNLLILTLPVVLSTIIYSILLYKMDAFADFKESFVDSIIYGLKGKDQFVNFASGVDDIAPNALLIIKSFLYHLMAIVGLCLGSQLLHRKGRKLLNTISGITIICLILGFACWTLGYLTDLQYRCIPLVISIFLMFSAYNMLRGNDYKYNHSIFTLNAVALMLILKIFLCATPFPYGFYLLNIGLIGYYKFFIDLTKTITQKCFSAISCTPQYISLLLIFVCLMMTSWWISAAYYNTKNIMIDTGRGDIYCSNSLRSVSYWNAVEYLRTYTLDNESLVVIPSGASINFFSSRNNPLKYILFHPGDIDKNGEQTFINDIDKNKVTYIAIVSIDAFGIDYGIGLLSWIYENYVPVRQFGANPLRSNQFGILLFKRKT